MFSAHNNHVVIPGISHGEYLFCRLSLQGNFSDVASSTEVIRDSTTQTVHTLSPAQCGAGTLDDVQHGKSRIETFRHGCCLFQSLMGNLGEIHGTKNVPDELRGGPL